MGIRPLRLVLAATTLLLALMGASPAAQAQTTQPDYTLNAGDTLSVSVYKEDELKQDVVIRPDGKFSFPLAGEINASGRTVAQIEADITSRLLKYIPEAVVSASVKSLDGCRIYIIGQVSKPGSFVLNPRMSVLQALSLAGGTTPFASVNDIIVLRGTGAQQKVLPFRYSEVSKGRNLSQNVMMEPGDVLVVP